MAFSFVGNNSYCSLLDFKSTGAMAQIAPKNNPVGEQGVKVRKKHRS